MNKPTIEALKEIGRWVAATIVSWVITTMLEQITAVPESTTINIWVFAFAIPVRALIQFGLTLAGRALDKYVFENNKLNNIKKGILPW